MFEVYSLSHLIEVVSNYNCLGDLSQKCQKVTATFKCTMRKSCSGGKRDSLTTGVWVLAGETGTTGRKSDRLSEVDLF